jgi:hypothetical protein
LSTRKDKAIEKAGFDEKINFAEMMYIYRPKNIESAEE